MRGLRERLGGSDPTFDAYDEFVPDNLPDPGAFLDGHTVLSGDEHCQFHETTRDLFEERGVYDVTFNYNLARLNLDQRHPDAGYRYAEESPDVLRAEFTPTTAFCPQTETLTKGSFRAWNGLAECHGYDLVRVRVDGMHHASESVNEQLRALEDAFEADGEAALEPGNDPLDAGEDEGLGGGVPGSPF